MTIQHSLRIRYLQRKCARALRLHSDLTEASCEILFQSEGLSARDRVRLARLRRQEDAAMAAYLRARSALIRALSVAASRADRRECASALRANS